MDRLIKKKKWPPKKIAGISIASLFFLSIFYFLFFGDKSSKLNVKAERLTISTVSNGLFQEFIPIVGTVLPIKTIYLDAMQGGQVEALYLEAGSFVKQGDKILKLENTNLLLDIMQREAQLFEQTNSLRNTRLEMARHRLTLKSELIDLNYQIQRSRRIFDRNKELLKKVVSRHDYEQSKDDYEHFLKRKELTLQSQKQDSLFREVQIQQLEASVARMQNNLSLVQLNLESLELRSPITGQLTSLHAEMGQSISRGQRFGQIDVLDSFKVRTGIDEHYIARIEIGRTGSFQLSAQTYRLIVKKIYPEVLEGRFQAELFFDGAPPTGIRRGQTLHIRLELGDLSVAVLLPQGGFFQKTGGQWVYVLDKSGDFASKRNIRLGRKNTEVFEVLEGLEPGEKVITSSYDNFGNNEKLIFN